VGERVIRIGVTGHRQLDAPDEVARVVDRAIDDVLAAFGADVSLVVVSSLAEGADRLVAREVLARPGAQLEAILPLAIDEYARDFDTPESQDEYHALLDRAASVRVVPTDVAAPREQAYEAAGMVMLDRSDVVLALWDGEESRGRGGTAEMVRIARDRGRRVVVIPVSRAVVETGGAPAEESTP
jgi:hypothetical protein